MDKRIFTPFPEATSGRLSGRLQYVGDEKGGRKPDEEGKPKDRTKGFQQGEYVYAPPRDPNGDYKKTGLLAMLVSAEAELYINAHCRRGIDYLSSTEDCKGAKVAMDDLIKQIEAHGLPKETKSKIKLWACEGALDDGDKKSFAQQFSEAFHKAGYTNCPVFGYWLSLFSEYHDGADGLHKRVTKTDQERMTATVEALESKIKEGAPLLDMKDASAMGAYVKALRGDLEFTKRARLWAFALTKGNREKAMEWILGSPPSIAVMLGEGAGGMGGRAKGARRQFKAGVIVP
jgi:hypothetical protein